MNKRLIAAMAATLCATAMGAALAEAPVPAAENGVITADEWSTVHPEIVVTYKNNEQNNYRISYIEKDPYITTLYEGFGFAKDYTSAIGHTYTLKDVAETERPHALANCLTCKTPDFTKLVNDMGVDAYSLPFDEVYAKMGESVSCYNCHANEGDKLVVTHSYVKNALGTNMDSIAPQTLSCGQCHIEYYFDPATKATMMPYDSVEAMSPEAILAYYNEMDFADWTQPSTGTRMLKAQHPEFETFLGEGSVHKNMMNCASCHMEKSTTEAGVAFTSHTWTSPLASESLTASCAACHGATDMKAYVGAIQEEITARETEVGEKLAALKTKLAEAVASGARSEEDLNAVRSLYRDAQWYWDFCYVENSEGAHNSKLARKCLDTAEALAEQAMALL
ncbi:MAG: ammonia-forming cytochrome c nitrite reductase subunit c552 [Clostridia bacterium]|nr:ammonia-forming cytochrome c nitrite reductase subunit c552 [Clostridia bacterium]